MGNLYNRLHGQAFHPSSLSDRDYRSRTIRVCEDICYNLRRVHGALHPIYLQLCTLLSELYTTMGHFREAQGVHESILRRIVDGDDDDDRTIDTVSAADARRHVDLLKQSYLRLKGWDKSPATYKDLITGLVKLYKGHPEFKDVQGIEKWDFNKEGPSETLGNFQSPKDWDLVDAEKLNSAGDAIEGLKASRNPGLSVKRATSNWGIGEVMRVLQGAKPTSPTSTNGNLEGIETRKPAMESKAMTGGHDDGLKSAEEGVREKLLVNGAKA